MPGAVPIVAVASCALLIGCATTQTSDSTRLQPEDVLEAAEAVRAQLAGSQFLMLRAASDPRWVILPELATNRSDDRLTEGERWMVTAGVARQPNVLRLLESKNIAVQVPPIDADTLERFGIDPARHELDNLPTHVLQAEVASIARAASVDSDTLDERRDTYLVSYDLVELLSRRVVWNGSAEFARRATGLLID